MQLVDVQVRYSLLLDMFFLQIQIQNKYMKNQVWYDLPSDVFHTAVSNIDTFLAKMKVRFWFVLNILDNLLKSPQKFNEQKNC